MNFKGCAVLPTSPGALRRGVIRRCILIQTFAQLGRFAEYQPAEFKLAPEIIWH